MLLRVYEKQRERFAQNKTDAEKLLAVGESKRNDKLDVVEHAAFHDGGEPDFEPG